MISFCAIAWTTNLNPGGYQASSRFDNAPPANDQSCGNPYKTLMNV